jgi:hypothetical protein
VTEQRERLEKALRGCAEAGVPDSVDLWSAISERMNAERMSVTRARGGPSMAGPRRRVWFPRLVPNHPLGWTLAVLSALILGVGIYVISGPVHELLQHGLPGTVGPGSKKEVNHSRNPSHSGKESGLRTEIGQTQTADGARVTLDWAYADEKFVAVGLHTQRLDGPRGSELPDPDKVVLEPSLWDDTVSNEAELPPYVKITDESGQDFDTVGGGTRGESADAVFDAPEGIEPGREHRFRLEVPLQEVPLQVGTKASGEPEPGPFVFDFELPVRPAPTIELSQRVEAKGVTLTLERVVDSPLLPQAVVCFEPPDDEHSWTPFLKYDESYEKGVGSAPQKRGDGCWSLEMAAPMEGRSSVTVTNLQGFPSGPLDPSEAGVVNPKTIRGPWIFEFKVPGT